MVNNTPPVILKPGRKFRTITIEIDEHGQTKFMAQEFSPLGAVGPLHPLDAASILSQLTANLLVSVLSQQRGSGAAQQQKENPS
jgi:hypothetical protein